MEQVLLDPIVQYAIGVVGAILSAIATWALKNLADMAGVRRDADIIESIDDAIDQGLVWAEKKAMKEAGSTEVSLGSESVNQVANDVIDKFPKWMNKVGFGSEDIVKMVESKL